MSTIDATPEFYALGREVTAEQVPALVEAGRTVFAAGYGDDEDGFDALDVTDLWAFDPSVSAEGAAVVASWAPFVVVLVDCSCCGMSDYRTADGGCTYCNGRQVCCLN